MARKVLLVCGLVASLLYVATDVVAAVLNEGYSYISQTVSELFAIGASTRPLVVSLFVVYAVLMIAFGLGVRRSADGSRALRIAGGLLVGYGLFCLAGPFTPMHMRGAGVTLTDTLHKLSALVDVVFILLIIGFGGLGANVFGKRFRLYSIATMLATFAFGALGGTYAPQVEANLPTPWVGVIERTSIYASLLWMAMLSIRLMRIREIGASDDVAGPRGPRLVEPISRTAA